jgi:CheY-like chemotaxis protein
MDISRHRKLTALRALLYRLAVLVVDDAEAVRTATGLVLEDLGARVRTAADGAEALERLRDELPDLVLCDLMMPRLDGRQLIRALRGDPRWAGLPVVAVSGIMDDRDVEPLRRLGFDACLAKPFSEVELGAAVFAAARARRALLRRQCRRLRTVAADKRAFAKRAVARCRMLRKAAADDARTRTRHPADRTGRPATGLFLPHRRAGDEGDRRGVVSWPSGCPGDRPDPRRYGEPVRTSADHVSG